MSNIKRRMSLGGVMAVLLVLGPAAWGDLPTNDNLGNNSLGGGLGSTGITASPTFGASGSMMAPPTPQAPTTPLAVPPATQPTPLAAPTPLAPPTPQATTQPSGAPASGGLPSGTGLGGGTGIGPMSRAAFPLILAAVTAIAETPAAAAPKSGSSSSSSTHATANTTDSRRDTRAPDLRTEHAARMRAAVEQLTMEAKELDDFTTTKHDFTFTRPHPILSTWGPEMAVETLQRMLQPFTGNDFRDGYIRWHLMAVVKKATLADRKFTGPMLVQLIKIMPGPLTVKGRDAYHWEPVDIAAKYFAVCYAGQIWVGYPPFQHIIDAPASYQYMTAEQAATAKAKLEEAAILRDKIHIVTDPGALAWNERVHQINFLIREYRGDLFYALMLTGDPSTAKLVMNEIARQVQLKTGIAFDLLAFVYLAAFDKALNLYDQKTLNEMSAILETAARSPAADEWMDYGGQKRNFAQYAFHLIYMLQDGGGFIDAKEDEASATNNRRRH